MNEEILTQAPTNQRSTIYILGAIALIGVLLFVQYADMYTWDFLNNLWGPAYLLLSGSDPYAVRFLFEGGNAVWMPTIVGASVPLGLLSQEIAMNLWTAMNILATFAVIYLSIPVRRPNPMLLAIALIGTFVFPAFLAVITLGQISIFNILLWFLALNALTRGRIALAAFLLVMTTAKPQLLILIGPGLLLFAYRTYGWREAVRFVLYGVLWSVLLTIPLWIGYPDWLEGFWVAFGLNPAHIQPSSLYTFKLMFGDTGGIIAWIILAAALLIVTVRMWWYTTDQHATLKWTIFLTTLAAPYFWTWDFILVIPILIFTMFSVSSNYARAIVILGFAGVCLLIYYIHFNAYQNVSNYWWVSWVLLLILCLTWWIERQSTPAKPALQADA